MSIGLYGNCEEDTFGSGAIDREPPSWWEPCDYCGHVYRGEPRKRTVDGFDSCQYCSAECHLCCDRRHTDELFVYQRERHCEECLKDSIAEDERATPAEFDLRNYLDARIWMRKREDAREQDSGVGGSRNGGAVDREGTIAPEDLLHAVRTSGADSAIEAAPAFSAEVQ